MTHDAEPFPYPASTAHMSELWESFLVNDASDKLADSMGGMSAAQQAEVDGVDADMILRNFGVVDYYSGLPGQIVNAARIKLAEQTPHSI